MLELNKEFRYCLVENRLEGFFSNVMVILDALNSMKIKGASVKNICILWNNNLYQNNTENLCEKYLFKNLFNETNLTSIKALDFYSRPGFFINANYRNQINDILFEIQYYKNLYYKKFFSESIVQNSSVLGVQIRRTDHSMHGKLLDLEEIIKLIEIELLNFDYENIFIATDDVRCLSELISIYKDRIIFNQGIARSISEIAIHRANYENKEKLAQDVLLDAISLSKCKKLLITSSNVSHFAVCLNKELNYEYMNYKIDYK